MDRDIILPEGGGSPFLRAVPRRPALTWRNAYDNGTAYQPNDAVEYLGSSYICILASTGNLPTNATYWSLLAAKGTDGAQGADGADGAPGADGAQGAFGGAVTIEYLFSTTTTDGDPGSGNLRLSNATQNLADVIRVDPLDVHGDSWSAVVADMANAVTGQTGYVRLVNKVDPTKWLLFFIDQVNPETGYFNIFGTVLASSDANPFANGNAVLLLYDQNGVDGEAGAPGADGSDATLPDIQVFIATGSNTWTKPVGAVSVTRHLIGAGAGGGSGRRGATGSTRGGGGGGGGGGYATDTQLASYFGATETVTVGAGGTGGAGVTTDSTDGADGAAGGNTSMTGTGSGGATLTANGGSGGAKGTNSGGGAGGSGGSGNTQNGATGGNGNATTGLSGDGGEITTGRKNAGGGGGGGAGINSSNLNSTTGGWGGAAAGNRTSRTLSLLGAAVANCLPHYTAAVGSTAPAYMAGSLPVAFGGGGGAGGANALSYATSFCGSAAGGPGGLYGGGGGGGAGVTNSPTVTVSNDGFFGGQGIAIVVTTF